MKIAIIGGTGRAGSRIAEEALNRGHEVTVIARDISSVPDRQGLSAAKGDALDPHVSEVLKGHDVVVSSAHFATVPAEPIITATKAAGVKRLVVVGGAGGLTVPGHGRLIDQPYFPAEYKPEAEGGIKFLEDLKTSAGDLEWTFLSPSGNLEPGERKGVFRLGGDELLIPAEGQPGISMEDLAIAIVDEIEKPQHTGRRFTAGY